MKVVILLPTYNEKDNIIALFDGLKDALAPIRKHEFRILVIDDNSPDGTSELVRKVSAKYGNISLIVGDKQGLGKALLRGMKYAVGKLNADIIIQMDADLSHDPAVIPDFLAKIEQGSDFVVGSRYIRGGSIPSNWGLHRKIFSIAGNSIVRFGLGYLGVHDWTGGYRAYRKKYVDLISPFVEKYNGYVFQIAFLHQAELSGAKISEVPINFTDRLYGRSKIIFSEYIRHIMEYVISERIKSIRSGPFGKFLVVGTIGLFINTVLLELFVKLGLISWASNMIGAECAIISNFILNNRWTFSSRSVSGFNALVKFLQFNGTSIIGVTLIQTGTIWLGTRIWGEPTYRIWYVFGTGMLLVWNYLMYSRVIWKKH